MKSVCWYIYISACISLLWIRSESYYIQCIYTIYFNNTGLQLELSPVEWLFLMKYIPMPIIWK